MNGLHKITTTFYSDPHSTNTVWQGEYNANISNGIFNIFLGSGNSPLPEVSVMNRQLWLGIRVDEGEEMSPLTQLASVPYALNVSDKSITMEKLAPDVLLSMANIPKVQGTTWDLAGNGGTTPGTDFVGTTNSKDLFFKINSAPIMKYEIGNSSIGPGHIIGGSDGNKIVLFNSTTGPFLAGIVIAGGGTATNPNEVDASFSSIGGGFGNSIKFIAPHNGESRESHDVIGGGRSNTIEGGTSETTIGGGSGNQILSSVGGPTVNDPNLQDYLFIGGGAFNKIHLVTIMDAFGQTYPGEGAGICAGEVNSIFGTSDLSFIGGGLSNTIGTDGEVPSNSASFQRSMFSTISGGRENKLLSNGGFVGGGTTNTIDVHSDSSVIGGGFNNTIDGTTSIVANTSSIVGGDHNEIKSSGGMIGGGTHNLIDQNTVYSVIAGGMGNQIVNPNNPGTGGYPVAGFSFIGGGLGNSIQEYNSASVIGGGIGNQISEFTGIIGGGWANGIHADYGSIGGGIGNVIENTPRADYAAIPGGRSLIAAGFAQTVIGSANLGRGFGNDYASPEDFYTTNDPIFIIGNGHYNGVGTLIRSNAFEVSNNGHSTVFGVSGSGGATIGGGVNPAIYGATYGDNIIYAWAIVPAGGAWTASRIVATTADVGVRNITENPQGTFTVVLNTVKPDGTIMNFSNAAVVVTKRGTGCLENIAAEPIISGNSFVIHTSIITQNTDKTITCGTPPSLGFMFIVTGRQ